MTAKVTKVERFTLHVPFVDRVRLEMERAGAPPEQRPSGFSGVVEEALRASRREAAAELADGFHQHIPQTRAHVTEGRPSHSRAPPPPPSAAGGVRSS